MIAKQLVYRLIFNTKKPQTVKKIKLHLRQRYMGFQSELIILNISIDFVACTLT